MGSLKVITSQAGMNFQATLQVNSIYISSTREVGLDDRAVNGNEDTVYLTWEERVRWRSGVLTDCV